MFEVFGLLEVLLLVILIIRHVMAYVLQVETCLDLPVYLDSVLHCLCVSHQLRQYLVNAVPACHVLLPVVG